MEQLKKYGGYVAVLLTGLLLGYLMFRNTAPERGTEGHDKMEHGQVYSCAMHPQIQQAQMGKCPICGMDLTPMKEGGAVAADQIQMTETAMALANIETTTIGAGSLEGSTLVLSGKIQTNEQTDAVQTSIFDGRIEALDVNYVGQYIKKGKKLGMIYAPEMYTAQDQLLSAASYKETHKKQFEQARNASGLWRMTDAQVAQVLRTGEPIFYFPIIADVSGTVTEVMAAEGNFYEQGDPLFKVSNLYSVWAVFDAYENQLPLLKKGQEVKIGSEAFNGREYKAKISFIDPVLDASRRTVAVRVTLLNKEGLLKPGMFVEGSVDVNLEEQVLTVPKSAVLWTGKRSLVYVKPDPDRPVFEMAQVTLGNSIGDSYAVITGLSPGDEVVTNGTFTVDAAAQLQGKKSMMSTAEGTGLSGDDGIGFSSGFKSKFASLLEQYGSLKDALVIADTKAVAQGALGVSKAIAAMDLALLEEATAAHMASIKKRADEISAREDLNIQRTHFKPLSEHMVALAQGYTNLDAPIYVQFCPMADNNAGASWISFQQEIRNPYFGDKMLNCGRVTKTIE